MRRESIPFESRALFITPWVVFFLHLVRDPVSHKFTCSTPLKSNWTCGRKLTQICDSISFNCWVGSFKRSIRMSNFGKTRPNGSQRTNNSPSDSRCLIQRLETHVVTIGPQWMKSPPSSFNPKMTMSHWIEISSFSVVIQVGCSESLNILPVTFRCAIHLSFHMASRDGIH